MKYVEAVRFSCAFNLSNNNQLVDLLREHVQNAKLISESTCMKTNSLEIKVLFFLFKFYFKKHSIFTPFHNSYKYFEHDHRIKP